MPSAFAAWLTTARFEAARGAATVAAAVSATISTILVTAVLVAAIVAAARFKIAGLEAAVVTTIVAARFTGRRSVFGRRKVASRSGVLLRRSVARTIVLTATAAAATTTTAPAPTSAAPAIATTFAASVSTTIGAAGVLSATATTVIAASKILSAPIAAATRWIVLRGIVVRRKILRSRSVRLRLLFVRGITAFAVKTCEMFTGKRIEGRSYVAGLGFGVFLARERAFTAGKMRDGVQGIRERQILKVFGFVRSESNFFAFGMSAVQSFAG